MLMDYDSFPNPLELMKKPEYDPDGEMSFEDRLRLSLYYVVVFLVSLLITLALCTFACAFFYSCATPKVVEQHHHHYQSADTLSVQAQVDARLQSWHQQMDSVWQERFSAFSSEWYSRSDEKEVTTETVTTVTDSLGRTIRNEQRTISRDISREQHQMEQRLMREYDERLRLTVDSIDGIWQQRFDFLQAHWEQTDSSSNVQTPVAVDQDNRPWYLRWWSALKFIAVGCVLAVILFLCWYLRRKP